MFRVTLTIALLCAALNATADLEGVDTYVVTDAVARSEALADAGAHAVVLPSEAVSEAAIAAVRATGLTCLAALALEDVLNDPAAMDFDETADLDGLLIIALPDGPFEDRPAWKVDDTDAAEGSMGHLLAVKRSGDRYVDVFRELSDATDLPLYLAMLATDNFPHTAHWQYIDRHVLLNEGVIDGVFLRGQEPDLRRPRLTTLEPILAGVALQPEPAIAAMTILRSRDVNALLIPSVDDAVDWLLTLHATLDGLKRAEQDREEYAEAVESERLSIVAAAKTEDELDVATVHDVAQSFVLDEPTTISGVGLKCMLRGPEPLTMPDMRVTIRPDADGEPDMDTVLSQSRIPAAAFAEPGLQWGYAQLDTPLEAEAGTIYWLHAADTTRDGNSCVWQITRNGSAYPGGHAWSRSYDYVQYDWIFQVLADGREAQ